MPEIQAIMNEAIDLHTNGNLALAYLSLDRSKEAVKAAWVAIKLNPNDSKSHCSQGGALDGIGDLAEAETSFCRALEFDPENGTALNNLGTIYMRNGDFDGSVGLFSRFLALAPNDPAVLS